MHDEYDEFVVALDSVDDEAAWVSAPREVISQNKRHNSRATPERFRGGPFLTAPQVPTAAPVGSTAGPTCLIPPVSQPVQLASSQCGSQQSVQRPAASRWNVRSIFLGSGGLAAGLATAPQPQQSAPSCHVQSSATFQPFATQPAPVGVPAHTTRGLVPVPSNGEESDDGMGPLTQMAVANGPVAAAFCGGCGCFLADLGDLTQQQHHTATCGQSAVLAAAATAVACGFGQQQQQQMAQRRQQQQQQQQAAMPGEDRESPGEEESWDDFDEEEGNWSEQEEATQAATAAAGYDEAGGGAEDADVDAAGLGDGEVAGSHSCKYGQEQAALAAFLDQHGLSKYIEHFVRAGAGLSLLPCLTDQDLQQLGIAALGARKKLLLAADELTAAAEEAAAGGVDGEEHSAGDPRWADADEEVEAAGANGAAAADAAEQQHEQLEARRASHAQAGGSGVGDWRTLMGGAGGGGPAVSCNILRYFKPTGGRDGKQQAAAAAAANPGCILSYLSAADGSALPVPPVAAAAAQQAAARGRGRGKQQQWAHKAVAAEGSGGGGEGKRWGPRAAQVLPMRQWQLVPGTPFAVDRFCNLPQQSPYRHWFLTHFHADHYKGLNGKFDRGALYCSPPTSLLVQQQLRVKPGCIRSVPLNSPIVVEGVRVTFLNANHCPGAVMILFEPPGRRPVLHTGDCRLIPQMQQEAVLQAVRGNVDLILDTTYCSPEYTFPSQQEVLKFAIDAVKAEAFNPKTLFLFGSYTIGKERLFLEAARVLQRKIYVSVAKRKILDCLELPPEYRDLLTTDDHETNLHAVPLWMVSQKHMVKLLKHYRGRFSTAVGFQPTGWTHQRDASQTKARGRRRQKGTIITYQVPYSEHSSFSELRQFVEWFRPVSITPSVNSDGGGPKAKRLVQLLIGQGKKPG